MDLKEMFPMKLGFGGLRLPTNGSKDDVNYIRMCEMVDEYVANGGNYFGSSSIFALKSLCLRLQSVAREKS